MSRRAIIALITFCCSIACVLALVPNPAFAEWGARSLPSDERGSSIDGGVARRVHYVIYGGYVAAGVAMRNKGYGTITISGIPRGSKVVRAFLYWDILNS